MGDKEDFGDRPKKLIEAFAKFDKVGAKKLPMPLVEKLLKKFPDCSLTTEEMDEFKSEADDQGFFSYDEFVKKVIFGEVK